MNTIKSKRVVSLLPSATDILYSLNAHSFLVGISHECMNKDLSANVVKCTSNKLEGVSYEQLTEAMDSCQLILEENKYDSNQCNFEIILELGLSVYKTNLTTLKQCKPNIIITQLQKVEDEDDMIYYKTALTSYLGYCPEIINLNPSKLDDIYKDIRKVSNALNMNNEGDELISSMVKRIEIAQLLAKGRYSPNVLFVQWLEPCFSGSAWMTECIGLLNANNLYGSINEAEILDFDKIKSDSCNQIFKYKLLIEPDVTLFCLCGLSIDESEKLVEKFIINKNAFLLNSDGRIAILDGKVLFSRPGPFICDSIESLAEILYPETHPYGHQNKKWKYLKESK